MVQNSPSNTFERYVLRLPEGLRERLKARAAANRRSLNSEIVVVLERAMECAVEDASHGTRA